VLDALRERAGDAGFERVHEPGCTSHKLVPVMSGDLVDSGVAGHRGFQTEYFDGFELEGEPVHARVSRTLERTFFGPFHPDVDPQRFSARFRGTFTPDRAGAHVFALTSAGRSRMFVDGELVIDNWTDPQPGEAWFGRGSREETADVELAAGESAELVIEYSRQGGAAGSAILPELSSMGGLRVGYLEPVPRDLMERAEAAARDADAALVVVGLNAEWETEGHDKQHMRLPGRQAELLERIAAANPRTIAVLNAGGPTDMDWIDAVPAVLQAWYGGQEAGRALVDVLFGDVDPGGRLPTTFARRLEDAPAHTDDAVTYPGENGRVVYAEDLLVGHRHYEANGIEPRFWLGHGLSYARFEYGEASVSSTTVSADEGVEVRVPVRNAAERAGSEVVQLYLADLASRLPRPPRELRAFTKVVLAPGEEALIRLRLGRRDLSYWDPEAHAFVAEPGEFEAAVGRSAGDLRSRVRFTLK
jgi:beta-glucosidase